MSSIPKIILYFKLELNSLTELYFNSWAHHFAIWMTWIELQNITINYLFYYFILPSQSIRLSHSNSDFFSFNISTRHFKNSKWATKINMPPIAHFKWAQGIHIIFQRMKFWWGNGGLAGEWKRNETKGSFIIKLFWTFLVARFLPFYMLLHSEMQRQHSRAGTRAHFVNNLWWWRLAASGYSCCSKWGAAPG